jgi:hypothetical protein
MFGQPPSECPRMDGLAVEVGLSSRLYQVVWIFWEVICDVRVWLGFTRSFSLPSLSEALSSLLPACPLRRHVPHICVYTHLMAAVVGEVCACGVRSNPVVIFYLFLLSTVHSVKYAP